VDDPVDLRSIVASGDGVAWSAAPDGVNVNLVVLGPGGGIGAHRNDAIDVLLVGVDGSGTLVVDGTDHPLHGGSAALVPKGALRAVTAGDSGVRYLTVHQARGPLGIRGRAR
jgi:quercetin dioxygenase-like cupin family protein